MTQEQKAKAYDKAIKVATALYKASEPMSGCNVIIETIFPELKESEDEKIRKALIRYFTLSDEHAYNEACGVSYRDIVAWLEKQGEQKPTDNEMKELLQTEYEKGRADAIADLK